MPIVTVENLTYRYGGASHDALRGVSLEIESGEWVVVQGVTGSGKSTLLKTLTGACPEFYGGTVEGKVMLLGKSVHELTPNQRASIIGFVNQDPEAGTVYDAADREVAFTLENQGVSANDMGWRVAEALELTGLSEVALRRTSELSGGQRQRLALAAALVHQPNILVLDEPTSQLDPVSASDLLDHLRRLQSEFGLTIVMSEHRLDAVYALADRVVYMTDGQVQYTGSTRDTARWTQIHALGQTPTIARLFPGHSSPALSVREAREHLQGLGIQNPCQNDDVEQAQAEDIPQDIPQDVPQDGPQDVRQSRRVITLDKVSARYRGAPLPNLHDCSLELVVGQVTAIIGPNGSGKSTLLRVLAGLMPVESGTLMTSTADKPKRRWRKSARATIPYPGNVKIGYLPQKPSDLFSQLTVQEEILLGLRLGDCPKTEMMEQLNRVASELDVWHLLDRSPRDLSGGEQMQVALAGLLVTNPQLLLLDEPTRGLDAEQKAKVGELIRGLAQRHGMTIVMVSHDMELVAQATDQVLFMFNGSVALCGGPKQVFLKGLYFSPPVARVFRGFDECVLSLDDAVRKGWAR